MSRAPQLVRFGAFDADLATGVLRKNGRRVKLQNQPFRVLAILIERGGETVTREELRQALWSTDTFVDFEQSLNAAVAKLRQALGDSADNPRFIETQTRRGYRFIAAVSCAGENGEARNHPTPPAAAPAFVSSQAAVDAPGARPRRPWRWMVFVFVLFAVGAVLGFGFGTG